MASGNKVAQDTEHAAYGTAQSLGGQAGGISGFLTPELMTEAAHPAGFTPVAQAKMKTNQMQTAGGINAGAAGQGALLASRTRNAGSGDAAIQESARQAGETLSKANLETDLANERLKEEQRQNAFSGLEHLYGTDLGGVTGAYDAVAKNAEANARSGPKFGISAGPFSASF